MMIPHFRNSDKNLKKKKMTQKQKRKMDRETLLTLSKYIPWWTGNIVSRSLNWNHPYLFLILACCMVCNVKF